MVLDCSISGGNGSYGSNPPMTIDISKLYKDYQKITVDNIIVQLGGMGLERFGQGQERYAGTLEYTYNPDTGVITIKYKATKGTGGLYNMDSYKAKVAIVR